MGAGGFKDSWGSFGDGEQPRPDGQQSEPPTAGTPSESGTERLEQAADLFPHWDDILEAVQKGLVEAGENQELASPEFAERFFEIVTRLVEHSPVWNVKPHEVQKLAQLLRSALFGYGPLEPLMRIEGLEEILANRFDEVWIIVRGLKRKVEPSPFRSEREIRHFVDRIMNAQGKELNLSNPADDGVLVDGSRIQATIPPVALDGTLFSIRKFKPQPFTMREYLDTGMFPLPFLIELRRWIDANYTIVISGGTASGKAQPLDAKVLTPTGYRLIGHLAVGDPILGVYGQHEEVRGVFPQGVKPCYAVVLAGNRRTRCCDEHLWSVRPVGSREEFEVRSLRSLLDEGLHRSDGEPRFEVPSYQPRNERWFGERDGVAILDVAQLGACEMTCIATSDSDELYVTDDEVITHNTTFINAVGALIPFDDRLLIMEDTPELQIKTADTIRLKTVGGGARGQKQSDRTITMRDLVRYALRLRPDRILIGEVRGVEAFDLLQALNTGHAGSFTTIHADAAILALSRLRDLAVGAEQVGEKAVENLVASAVDIVIQVGRVKGQAGRRVLEARQVFHPSQLTTEGKELLGPIAKAGDLQRTGDGARPPICSFPLFEWDGSQLVQRWDAIPMAGRELPPRERYLDDPFNDGGGTSPASAS